MSEMSEKAETPRSVLPEIVPEVRPLQDAEVDAVNGGLVVIAIIAILIGQLVPA